MERHMHLGLLSPHYQIQKNIQTIFWQEDEFPQANWITSTHRMGETYWKENQFFPFRIRQPKYYPDDSLSRGLTLSPILLIPEVEYRGRDAGVHDDQVGEPVRGVLDHAEASQAAPVLTHQGQVLHLTKINLVSKYLNMIRNLTSRWSRSFLRVKQWSSWV